ncbi:Wzz/FepE/Etk N-terminal domain-containing protein [Thioalkalivibrio sp.]|uniref:Wzz/FepE/Etk N-terminal domain-containing protein n=1 Tax=Chromatiales TaxID=135613 RepID=UPI0035635084
MAKNPVAGSDDVTSRETPVPAGYPDSGPYSDEISLVDLAKVLWTRRWWVVGITVGTVVLALLIALSTEHEYRYMTTVRIGELNIDKRVSNVDEVKETLERQLMPSLRRSFTERHGLERLPFDVAIEAEEAGGLVSLSSESGVENEGLVEAFHSELASMLVARHSEILDVISAQTEQRLEHLYARLEFHHQRLEELNRLGSAVAALEFDEPLNGGGEQDPPGSTMQPGGGEQDLALTTLMSRLQVSDLMNQYERNLSTLMRDIEDNELQRDWITPTHVVVEALRSESPVGTGRSLILALGLVLGAMLGLFGAFFAEFGAQVRESLKAPPDA